MLGKLERQRLNQSSTMPRTRFDAGSSPNREEDKDRDQHQHNDNDAEEELVLPQFCQTLAADAWPPLVGFFKKGAKLVQDQGVISMRSLTVSYRPIATEEYKEETTVVPFIGLPSLMYLTYWELIQMIPQFVCWEGERLTFDFTRKFTAAAANKDHYLRKSHCIFLYREDTQQTYELIFQ